MHVGISADHRRMNSIHICLKGLFAGTWLGGSRYIENLARAIGSVPPEEKEHIRLSVAIRSDNAVMARTVRSFADRVYLDGAYGIVLQEALKRLALIPGVPVGLLNPRRYDFVYPDISGKRAPYIWAGWIPDFQYRYLPHMFTERQIERFERVYSAVAQNATAVILSSTMAEDDFKRFYPEAASRSRVMKFVSHIEPAWFTAAPKETQEKYGLPDEFFIVCNQFWKHKDHKTVIEALAILKSKGVRPVVVCTGSVDKASEEYFRQIVSRIDDLGLIEQIRILGFIPRYDQVQLMRRSIAVIQPSLFEGWSTVVEDARSLGKAVLLSDFPVHIEQNPPEGRYFERENPEQLAVLINDAMESMQPGPEKFKEAGLQGENREKLVAYGKRFLEIVRGVYH